MTRLAGAIQAVHEAVAAATGLQVDVIDLDDDLATDLILDSMERESLSLIVEEVFSVTIPEELWNSPLYRSVTGLAEWLVRKTEEASWAESRSMSGVSPARTRVAVGCRKVGGR